MPNGRDFLLLDDAALLKQCAVDCYRASGPGGQKRNKTSSAVRLRHQPTGLCVVATEDRSQHVNKSRALRRLRQALALHERTPVDREAYQPSPLLRACVDANGAIRVSRRDPRYWLAVHEILDVFAACGATASEAAKLLHLPTARFVKLLRSDEKLWARANELRAREGMEKLR